MDSAATTAAPPQLDHSLLINPPRLTWDLLELNSECPPGRSGHTVTKLRDGELVQFGGGGDGKYFNDLWHFDSKQLRWQKVEAEGQTPDARAYHAAVSLGGTVVIFGGWKGDQFLNSLSLLEPASSGPGGAPHFKWSTPHVSGDAPGIACSTVRVTF